MHYDTQEIKRVDWAQIAWTPSSNWYIREAQAEDAEALRVYCHTIAHGPQNNTSLRRELIPASLADYCELIESYRTHPNCYLLVVIDGERVVGQLRMTGDSHIMTAHVVELSINILPAYQGRGLGTALIGRALAWARTHGGVRRVQLEVLARNTDALRLYERFGFQIEGRRVGAYHMFDEPGAPDVDVYMMSLTLSPPRRAAH